MTHHLPACLPSLLRRAFLRIHEDAVMAYPEVAEKIASLNQAQCAASLAFKAKCQQVLCLVGAFANIQ
jgi:hypothetical protein